jgi:type VI secretion system protein ImpB
VSSSGQKFIGRNRAPRVQIEYEVEVYGSQKKVQLPFVMGVMSDLLGAPETPPAKLEERKFMEVDMDNFDARMKAMKPRIAITVSNELTGEGNMPLTLDFQSLDDFSPAALARRVEPLRELLEARSRLSDLIAYMDGRGDAEQLLSEQLKNPSELKRLVETLNLARKAEEET